MLEKISLFTSKREILNFILACGFILSYSLLIEFQNYKNLIRFDSALVSATVLNQYTKTKELRTYQVLKLKSDSGFTFYTAQSKSFPRAKGKKITLEIFTDKITFYDYFTSFYANSKVLEISSDESLKEKFNNFIASEHQNEDIANIYQALFTATPLSKNLQSVFSTLGVSHLLAISGFHLGVLSALLFFLLKYPYKILQDRYFPYRNLKLDIFIIISSILLIYLLFLDSPPSLLRAFGMLVIGSVLYDRGFKIISMQTLLLTTVLLLVFFPRLLFALGFWLSVGGVFYIFLFLIHFKNLSKVWQFILIPFWTYLLMLPFSLALFGSFSIYHPLSILWTTLFILFYPLSIFLHLIGYGAVFDGVLESFISLGATQTNLTLGFGWLIFHIMLSLLGILRKSFIWLLFLYSLSILIYTVYHIT